MDSFFLQVHGTFWQGFEGVYEYILSAAEARDCMKDANAYPCPAVTRKAADFARVLDWRLIHVRSDFERKGRTSRRVETQTTLRGFRSGMTPRHFANGMGYAIG